LMAQTNDALIAALCVWTIAAATDRPVARGLLMAAAALTKFLPALVAVQFLGVSRGRSRYAMTLAISLAAMLAWPVITSGPAEFFDSTFGYQLIQRGGGVQFSIWTYLPHVAIAARPLLAAALVLLALSPMFRRPVQDARHQAALAAALLIGAQLLLGYWFYSYLTWCYPLLIVAVIDAGQRVGQAAEADRAQAQRGGMPALEVEAFPRGPLPPPGFIPGREPASFAELVGDGLARPAEVADYLGVHPVRLGAASLLEHLAGHAERPAGAVGQRQVQVDADVDDHPRGAQRRSG